MRILSICDVLMPITTGGAGRMARETAIGLARQGAAVHVLTRAPRQSSLQIDSLADGIPVTFYPRPGHAALSTYRRLLEDVASRFRPDLVHIHQPFAGFLCAPWRLGAPVVYSFYSSWPEELKIKRSRLPLTLRKLVAPLYRSIERRVIEQSNQIIVLSKFSRDVVAESYGRDARIIPGGVDSRVFRPASDKPKCAVTRLGTVRNLVPRMGLEPLIDAMKQLPELLHLEIAGSGPLYSSLERRIRHNGLSDRVRLHGAILESELARFYCNLDYFILPTRALENFGLVILESLSCGIPVLGTRSGAIPELLEQFNPGWIIDRCDPDAIAATVRAALTTAAPDKLALHERIASQYDWDLVVAQYMKAFDETLEARPN